MRFVALLAASTLMPSFVAAQTNPSANYTTIDVEVGKVTRIGVYAQARKDCSVTELPTVRVVEFPVNGTLTVRPAKLTTSDVVGCPALVVPAQIVSYQGREAKDADRVLFSVSYPDGEIALYDVAIHFKEAPKNN